MLAAEVLCALPYTANDQQVQVVAALARFCNPASPNDGVFILNGYAGTGKTSLTGALVRTLEAKGIKAVLMAPTGRAAKVFSANSDGHAAFTIHRKIYRHVLPGTPASAVMGGTGTLMQDNKSRNTLFIVDEASMIGRGDDSGNSLLDDLIHYVYTGDNCRLILIGDTAQLPPVGSIESPAMDAAVLRSYGLKVTRATLTETARQSADSGILFNATRLRKAMLRCAAEKNGKDGEGGDESIYVPKIRTRGFDDVRVVDGEELRDLLESAYARTSSADTILITRSNRRAADYNRGIRSELLYRDEQIMAEDMLIVAKNHYFASGASRPAGTDFIANGDILVVEKVFGTERRYGLSFADVRLALSSAGTGSSEDTERAEEESPAPRSFEAKIILDGLYTESAALSREQSEALYYGVMQDPEFFSPETPMDVRLRSLRNNPYWTALQVKFAYAVTCHKAQGGQWRNVFVDLSYIPPESLGLDLYRWLYTAVTRARRNLYLISPPQAMLSGE